MIASKPVPSSDLLPGYLAALRAELAAVQATVKAACIGPITARTAREAGFDVAVCATEYTMPGLVDALVRWRSG